MVRAEREAAAVQVDPECGVDSRDLLIGTARRAGESSSAWSHRSARMRGTAAESRPAPRQSSCAVTAAIAISGVARGLAQIEVPALGGDEDARVEEHAHVLRSLRPTAAPRQPGRARRAARAACGPRLGLNRADELVGRPRAAREKRPELSERHAPDDRHDLRDRLAMTLDDVRRAGLADLVNQPAEPSHGVGGGDSRAGGSAGLGAANTYITNNTQYHRFPLSAQGSRGPTPRSVALRRIANATLSSRGAQAHCAKVSSCGAGGQTRLKAGDRSCAGRRRPPRSSASSRSASARPRRRLPCSTPCSSGLFRVSIDPAGLVTVGSSRSDRSRSFSSFVAITASRCARRHRSYRPHVRMAWRRLGVGVRRRRARTLRRGGRRARVRLRARPPHAASAGRSTTRKSETPGHRVAVISERLWRDEFDASASVVGQTIRLNDEPFSVVGVVSQYRGWSIVFKHDLWLPMAEWPAVDRRTTPDKLWDSGYLRGSSGGFVPGRRPNRSSRDWARCSRTSTRSPGGRASVPVMPVVYSRDSEHQPAVDRDAARRDLSRHEHRRVRAAGAGVRERRQPAARAVGADAAASWRSGPRWAAAAGA